MRVQAGAGSRLVAMVRDYLGGGGGLMLSTGSAYQHSSESGGGWLQSAVRRLDAVAMVIARGSERVEGRAGERGGWLEERL